MDEKTQASVFEKLIKEADIPKNITVSWDGVDYELKYKELIGDEGIEIERKYGDDLVMILLEQTYLMLAKANNGSPNDMDRKIWSTLPSKFRVKITMELNREEAKQNEVFQNLQEQEAESS